MRPRLIGLTGAVFNPAWITNKASSPSVQPRLEDYVKDIFSPGSKGPNPGTMQLDRAALVLHYHQKDMSSLIVKNVTKWHILFNILL